jgi:hypothetical protein
VALPAVVAVSAVAGLLGIAVATVVVGIPLETVV